MNTMRLARESKLLFLLLLLATTLRGALALRPGLWADEIFSLAMATGHSLEHPAAVANPALGDFVEPKDARPASDFGTYLRHENPPAGAGRVIHAVLLSDTSPPLYYLLLNAWTRVAGVSDAALRLFSTLWAVASFPLLWYLARRIGDRRTAWTACLLFALAPAAVYYSAEGRMYSLVWFLALVLASTSFALARRGVRPVPLLLWILSAAAGLLTHYFFAFAWLACCCWLWFYPHRIRRFQLMAAAALTGLIVLPWYLELPDSLGRWRVTGNWLAHPLAWQEAARAPFILAWSPFSPRGAWGGSLWVSGLVAGVCALIAGAVWRQGLGPLLSRRRWLPWLWVLTASVGPVLFDLFMGTSASTKPRYALPGLPGAILLAALGMSRLPRQMHGVFLAVLLVAWVPVVRNFFSGPARVWEPFPEVAAAIAGRIERSDLIIVHSIPSGVLALARYLPPEAAVASWVVRLDRRRIPEDMDTLVSDRKRVVLAKIHDIGEPSAAEEWLSRYAPLDHRDIVNVHPFYEVLYFRLPSPGSRPQIQYPAVD